MLAAVQKAGVVGMVNFNYRRVPAVQLAKKLIDEGRIGKIYHWRAVYLQDWIMDPNFPLVWRLNKDAAGSGTLGDLGAHIVDLARMLVGEITALTGLTETFIKQRPVLGATTSGLGAAAGDQLGEVTVDDAALFLARFASGAVGTFEVTRFANGRANYNSFEINGSKGSIQFNLERMNELNVLFNDDDPDVQGYRNVLVTDGGAHPMWAPGGSPGILSAGSTPSPTASTICSTASARARRRTPTSRTGCAARRSSTPSSARPAAAAGSSPIIPERVNE